MSDTTTIVTPPPAEQPHPVPAEAAATESAATDATATEPPVAVTPDRKRLPLLAIIGIAVGAALLAGGLFGGVVAVGLAIPSGGQGTQQFGPGQGGFPGAPGDTDRVRPGDDTEDDSSGS